MTILDGFLILLGVLIILFCAMEGLVRTFIMLVSFYLATTAAGMVTLATNAMHSIAVTFNRVAGGSGTPNMARAETIAFAGIIIPFFIGAYLLSKATIPDTTLPKLHAFDNIFGLLLGIILALCMMAVFYNTWGVAVSVRWNDVQLWARMRFAYMGAFLRPYMHQALAGYRGALFLFGLFRYPPFLIPQ